MKAHNATPFRMELPLSAFVLHPVTAAIAAVQSLRWKNHSQNPKIARTRS